MDDAGQERRAQDRSRGLDEVKGQDRAPPIPEVQPGEREGEREPEEDQAPVAGSARPARLPGEAQGQRLGETEEHEGAEEEEQDLHVESHSPLEEDVLVGESAAPEGDPRRRVRNDRERVEVTVPSIPTCSTGAQPARPTGSADGDQRWTPLSVGAASGSVRHESVDGEAFGG